MPYEYYRESELRYEVLLLVVCADVSRDHHWRTTREEGAAAEAAAAAGLRRHRWRHASAERR